MKNNVAPPEKGMSKGDIKTKALPEDGSIDAGLILLELHFKDTPLAQADIAEVCGTSVQNIQQYEWRALRKIRAELERRGLDPRVL